MKYKSQYQMCIAAGVFVILAGTALTGCTPRYGCYYGMSAPQNAQEESALVQDVCSHEVAQWECE